VTILAEPKLAPAVTEEPHIDQVVPPQMTDGKQTEDKQCLFSFCILTTMYLEARAEGQQRREGFSLRERFRRRKGYSVQQVHTDTAPVSSASSRTWTEVTGGYDGNRSAASEHKDDPKDYASLGLPLMPSSASLSTTSSSNLPTPITTPSIEERQHHRFRDHFHRSRSRGPSDFARQQLQQPQPTQNSPTESG